VEAEPARATHPRLVTEAGLQLGRMLAAAGLADTARTLVGAYPLPVPESSDDPGADWLELARGRALDAVRFAAALATHRDATGALTSLPTPPTLPAAALPVLERWLEWYDGQVLSPASNGAWNRARLEYGFAAAAGDAVLTADGYADGSLDWWSMSAGDGALSAPAPDAPSALTMAPTLPVPVTFPGKPADRFWEFEDAAVNLGGLDAGPTDLTRLLLAEFALVYGNDWFVVPVRLPVGSLFRATEVAVRDTFGLMTSVAPADPGLFHVTGLDGFLLAPTVAGVGSGQPLEQVALFRDELASMVWGVERTVQGVSGEPYDRGGASAQSAAQQLDGPPVDAQLVYRLATTVPDHWLPFVPVAAPGSSPEHPVVELERRALIRVHPDGSRHLIDPKGLLLGGGDVRLAEEEVPREGAILERSFQHARWFDGTSVLWVGRRRRAGRGEGSSGLRFDTLG
jgi:hypothetical protein